MNCPKCFNPLKPNQRFCEVCGAKIGAAEMDVDKTVAADPYDIPEQPQVPQLLQQQEVRLQQNLLSGYLLPLPRRMMT